MTQRNIAEHRAKEIEARLGYFISPEQRRAVTELKQALTEALSALEQVYDLTKAERKA